LCSQCLSVYNNVETLKNLEGKNKMKMSKEDKIRIIIDALDEVIPIPNHKEERIKDVLRKALRTIEEKESEDY
jgi:hypothetical protein